MEIYTTAEHIKLIPFPNNLSLLFIWFNFGGYKSRNNKHTILHPSHALKNTESVENIMIGGIEKQYIQTFHMQCILKHRP